MIVKNKDCRMCGGKKFKLVIDFGKNPLVNSLIEKKDLAGREPVFPLVVKRCQACSLVQVTDIVDSHEIYKNVDYLYFSGDMPGLKEYFQEYANDIQERLLTPGNFVVEIGSNDGLMLEMFKEKYKILGVDPSSNVVVRALKNNIPTVSDFFNERLAQSIAREFGQANVVYGNNCIAHLNNLRDLMGGVEALLAKNGVFVVECNYWGGMVKNKNYALIYHDHFSYFSLKNWVDFAPRFGMKVCDAIVTPAQGGSLRVFMKKGTAAMTARCKKLYQEEIATNLNSQATCDRYRKDVLLEAKKLHALVADLRFAKKKIIAGYGAAAKGFSVLKLAGINEKHINYFVDDSPAKQGKFTPVAHIPVISRKEADRKLPDYFFITAPNYERIIVAKEDTFRKNGGKFITVDSRIIETFDGF